MSSGEVLKADKDFTKEVDAAIPEAEKLASSNPQAGIDKLLTLEKQTRQASDLASTSRVIIAIVTIAKNAKDWNLMNEQVRSSPRSMDSSSRPPPRWCRQSWDSWMRLQT